MGSDRQHATRRQGAARHVRAVTLRALLAGALLWFSSPVVLTRAALADTPPRLERTVDASVTPGDDFFDYANGGWLKATALPAGRNRWGARDELEDSTRRRVVGLIEAGGTAPAGSAARKVADFHAAYLNEAAIEARGLASLQPSFHAIDTVADKSALTRLLGRSMRADVDPLGLGIYESAHVLGLSVGGRQAFTDGARTKGRPEGLRYKRLAR